MKFSRFTYCVGSLMVLAACAEEAPPVSVAEFMDNPRILEATMIRCAQNRTESRYDANCVNARDAVNRLEAAAERTRREGLEQQSERKRQALRRTQQAAAEARRLALERQRRREEEEYLGIFEPLPAQDNDEAATTESLPQQPSAVTPSVSPATGQDTADELPEGASMATEPPTDLGAIREELRRRQETPE